MFAPPVLAVDVATVQVLDTTRIAARTQQPFATPPQPNSPNFEIVLAGDAMTTPEIRFLVRDRRWVGTLSLAETLSTIDFELAHPFLEAVSMGSAAVTWTDRYWSLTLSGSASYASQFDVSTLYYGTTAANETTTTGTATMGSQPPAGASGGQSPSGGGMQGPGTSPGGTTTGIQAQSQNSTASIIYGTTYSNATLAMRPGRHTTLTLGGGYQLGGGLTHTSRLILPEQYGPHAVATVFHAPTAQDQWITGLNAQETTTSGRCPPAIGGYCFERVPEIQVTEGLRHQVTGTGTVSAYGGASVSEVRIETPNQNTDVLVVTPVAVLSYTNLLDSTGSARLLASVELAPLVDMLTGRLSDRAQATVSLAKEVVPRVLLTGTAGLAQSIPTADDPFPLTLFTASVEARIRIDRQIDLLIGEQDFWQNQTGYGTLASELGYVGAIVRTLPMRF